MRNKEIAVRGYHCDAYGHVNNARYLEFLEEARWYFLEPAIRDKFFEQKELLFVVVNLNINYRKPLLPNMVINVGVKGITYFNSRIVFKQEIINTKNGELCSDADVTFVLIHKDTGKPSPITDEIKIIFDELLASE